MYAIRSYYDGFRRRVRQHDGKLLAADPGRNIDVAHLCLQMLGQLTQHPVATLVAVGVVDFLEVVGIDQKQGKTSYNFV